jgi:FkbM family methyltransferase
MISHSLSRRIPYRLLRRVFRHSEATIGRQRVCVPLHDPAALAWIYWKPCWKTQLIGDLLARRTGTFVDIGANVGQTLADFFSTGTSSPYLGFEPNPSCLAFLAEVIRGSGIANARLLPLALSNENGFACLHLQDRASTDSMATLHADLRPGLALQQTWIATARFDSLRERLGLDTVSAIKIDVEGGELEVLEGMPDLLATGRPPILCEILLADHAADLAAYGDRILRLTRLLESHSYVIRRIVKDSSDGLAGVELIATLPVDRWSEARSEQCDYLLVPSEFDFSGLNLLN